MEEGLVLAERKFQELFGVSPDVKVFAPGRVNLIGEHVDYNDGFVLPFALPFKTIIVGKKSASNTTRIYSLSMNDSGEMSTFVIDSKLSKGTPTWANYVKGTIFQYLSDLPINAAFDALVWSNVPIGSGLSSSAALEVATGTFLETLYDIKKVSKVEKAMRCQKAEHTFADTPCGIMDQFISALAVDKNLLLIDCRTQEGTLVPFGQNNPDVVIVVTNSHVKHQLSGSEYPTRVKQCKEAVVSIQQKYPQVKALRDVTMTMLEEIKGKMSLLAYQRARHVISEDIRTLSAVEALKSNNFKLLGELMSASHDSLSKDYEVSCRELDILKDLAVQFPGVYGSRMTGGGFGGCTVTLVDKNKAEELKIYLQKEYFNITGIQCECFTAFPSAGAGIIHVQAHKEEEKEQQNETRKKIQNIVNIAVPVTVLAIAIAVAFRVLR